MTRFNDNWFDVMFDEAVEELEKENEKNLKKTWQNGQDVI